MESLKGAIGTCMILFIAVQTCADTNCPDIYIERGGSKVIFCPSNLTFHDFYWYRGKTTSSVRPILGLEGGEKGGTEYGGNHFDIFENGSMVMKNVEIDQESYYTFLGYNNDGSFDGATFLVNVTVSPEPQCPVITGCSPCEDCIIDNPKETGTLTCGVTGARPAIPLSWTITSESGISFFQRKSIKQRNDDIDSWDTTLSLDYEVTESCGALANVQCLGEDIAGITSTNIASLQINNGICYIPATEGGLGLTRSLMIVLAVVVLCIMILIACCYTYRKKEQRPRNDQNVAADNTSTPLVENEVTQKSLVTRKRLVEDLATFYERFCSLMPLPWGEPIPISTQYSDFQCKVTAIVSSADGNGESKDIEKIKSSEDLFASSNFNNASRVLFIADLGYGKTTMTQHVVQQWIKEDKKGFILIYLQMKDVDINKSIALAVNDMLPNFTNADVKDIEKVLKQNKVLVLLDGLDELERSVEEVVSGKNFVVNKSKSVSHHRSESVGNAIILGDLLKGKVKNINVRVWVTSREVDDMKAPFPPPYLRVKMTGFSDKQIDSFLRKTCKHYCESVQESGADTPKERIESVIKNVKDMIEKDDIIQEFVNTPLLLVLIIHILAGKVTGTVAYLKDLHITKLTKLIRTVISCLESRYVQKTNDESIEYKIKEIERKLGEIAWKQKLEVPHYDREGWDKLLGSEYVNIAISIGLLRLSKKINNNNAQMKQLAFSSFTGVVFYHQYFLEYLAGEYFSTEEQTLKKLEKSLDGIPDDKTFRFLQFMSGSNHQFVTKVSDIFLKDQKKWNNFVDFIYETDDQIKVKLYLEKLSNRGKLLSSAPVMNFKYLDKKYHQNAVLAFCESCNKFKINIKEFTFRQDCPVEYLTKIVLPQLEDLKLLGMNIAEEDFVSILEWISTQNLPKTFLFIDCTFQDELSNESKEKIKTAMNGKEIKICRKEKRSQKKASVESFHVKKGSWTKE